jgi:uncharacterized membrane protein YbaN (DUF454 family)
MADLKRPVLSRTKRYTLNAIGWTSVGVGVLGMVVPVLPTTCFLLLAGGCFAKSSPRASRWLHTNRLFGRYLSDYREAKVIPLRVKAVSLVVLWATIGATVVAVPSWLVRAPVLLIAFVITVHVAGTASRRIEPAVEQSVATS